MPSERVSRPRTLSAVFGAYFLLMAIIAWYSGQSLGYRYLADTTRFSFMIYLIVGAIFLAGVLVAAVLSARSLDARIEKLEAAAPNEAVIEEVLITEATPDVVPPPLDETPNPTSEHVDRDIDELLVSLQEMEQDAGSEEAEQVVAPPARETSVERTVAENPLALSSDSKRLTILRKKRDGLIGYVAGPALASIGVIGVSAAMLPGSDNFLQTYSQLNTSLLLGLAYTFVGIAAYVAASVLLLVRSK
jgi:hypothetical protein